ncbi:TPA: HigA family addiction module antitoxin [Enterobacter kobei]|uniref:HigA family addiction module antitoxin n=1 Tax=Enterobacter TaxID=547 RepID=UPI0009B5235A|nr:HigA family addiction module antitoxin [Enterobacter kobei]HDS5030996.1 HigA family addiction module antidote protein [Enterobacter kobei]
MSVLPTAYTPRLQVRMAQNLISDDQAGHQNTLVNGAIVMPTDYAYERARQAKRRALRSCSRWMQGCENLQSPVPAERIRGILALNEITMTTFARAMNMSLSACHYLVYGSSRITPETTVRLSYVLGGTPEHWLKMQNDYELLQIKVDKRSLSRLVVTMFNSNKSYS